MRTRRRRMTKIIDSKIEAVETKLELAKDLETLIIEHNEIRKRGLLKAFGKSGRTYEEILNFIRG